MEDQFTQVPKGNQPNWLLTVLLIAGGLLVVLCGLAIVGAAYYVIARPYFGPKSQAILAPDHSLVSTVRRADLVSDAGILTARAQALGARVTFRLDGNDQIIAEGPPAVLTRGLIDKISAVGLLELVDFGTEPVPDGTKVATDFDYPYFAAVPGTKWHTVMTNAEFATVLVQAGPLDGQYEIAFTLTNSGKQTLSDFTTSHIGEYLGIIMDKKVLSSPVIKNGITDGQGVIEGAFTRDSAESLAAYLRVRGPLPIPVELVDFVESAK